MKRMLFTPDHEDFRQTAREFLAKEVVPRFPDWEAAGLVPREIFGKIGELGVLGIQIPEEFGGGGSGSFLYSAIWAEETARACVNLGGLSVHLNVVLPYFLTYCSEGQRPRWIPGLAGGGPMTPITMTRPGPGSDLARTATTAAHP